MDLVSLQPNTFTSITTEKSIDALWNVVADPRQLPALSSELQEVRLVTDEPIGLGTRFEGDQLRGERRWTTISTVTGFEPRQLFEWTVGDLERPVSRWSFLLDANAAGTTLTHKVTLLGGPSPLSDMIAERPLDAEEIVAERLATLRQRMAVTIEGLIERAGA